MSRFDISSVFGSENWSIYNHELLIRIYNNFRNWLSNLLNINLAGEKWTFVKFTYKIDKRSLFALAIDT